jgi:hypothetical protein
LICAGYAATAAVLMFEAWMRLAPPGGQLDMQTPPSEALDRREVVLLIAAGPTGARPPTPRRDGLDRSGAQRNAIQQLKPSTACQRFRAGPRSGARNRYGAARPPQSAEETDPKSAGADRG